MDQAIDRRGRRHRIFENSFPFAEDQVAGQQLHFPGHRERRIRPIVNTKSGAS